MILRQGRDADVHQKEKNQQARRIPRLLGRLKTVAVKGMLMPIVILRSEATKDLRIVGVEKRK